MQHAQAQRKEVQNILPSSEEHQRQKMQVRTMALEIERLTEETKQLRAAVSMYREVARRLEDNSVRGTARETRAVALSAWQDRKGACGAASCHPVG